MKNGKRTEKEASEENIFAPQGKAWGGVCVCIGNC